MASERMKSSVSTDSSEPNSKLSDHYSVVSANYCDLVRNESIRGISTKVLEKRDVNSYRNLPGLFETASSPECIDKKVGNSDPGSGLDVTKDRDETNGDVKCNNKKRKRNHPDYKRLSQCGYGDRDRMGRRYSSSSVSDCDIAENGDKKSSTNSYLIGEHHCFIATPCLCICCKLNGLSSHFPR